MNKKMKIVLICIIAVILIAGGVALGIHLASKPAQPDGTGTMAVDGDAQDWEGTQDVYTGEKNIDTIDIPGFDLMNLKSDTKKQSVNLYNPEQNTCYFKLSLYLEDGTLLWESGLIEPGKGLYEIELSQTLSAGSYENAILKYDCFTMDEAQTPLNGSEIKLTLNVLS